ncbi:MAG: DTW domain-containing protein [Verrucomicrobiales bacterium]|nr:DTW domain-containing protein [Verrucomicrobiales bacterium]
MNLCLRCRRRLATCVCDLIRPFKTKSRFVILMHPKEFKKEKVGTGRFTHLILENSEIVVGINFDEDPRFQALLGDPNYETVLLYPGPSSIDLSNSKNADRLAKKPLQFIILDGTWSCAKKMMRLTTRLHPLPRVSFETLRTSEFLVKQQPGAECLSTVESVHQVVTDLNVLGIEKTDGREENLMDVFRHTVQQQITLATDKNRQSYRKGRYKLPSERKVSKRRVSLVFLE